MLAEIGLLLELAQDRAAPTYRSLINGYCKLILSITWSKELNAKSMVLPCAAIAFATRAHPAAEELVDPVRDVLSSLARTGEVRPVVEMARRYIEAKFLDVKPRFLDLVPHSVLRRRLHPELLDREDVYDLTHWIFYLTDFCRQRLPSEMPADVESWIVDYLPRAMGAADRLGDSDLLAELVACEFALTRQPMGSAYWSLLQEEMMAMRFRRPQYSRRLRDTLPPALAISYEFRHHYHTYVAMGIADTAVSLGASQLPG